MPALTADRLKTLLLGIALAGLAVGLALVVLTERRSGPAMMVGDGRARKRQGPSQGFSA